MKQHEGQTKFNTALPEELAIKHTSIRGVKSIESFGVLACSERNSIQKAVFLKNFFQFQFMLSFAESFGHKL